MPYVITESCIDVKDGACVDACPVDCIEEGESQFFIDPDRCVDCDLCAAVCPVHAIFKEDRVPGPQEQFIDLNRDFFRRPGQAT